MADLIARIEAAGEGSRELDAEIGARLRIPPEKSEPWIDNWAGDYVPLPGWPGHVAVAHADGRAGVHWRVPHYTTSIDAALPGENICGTVKHKTGLWSAMHEAEDGHTIIGVAKTEALARRAAALRAREHAS